MKQVLPNLTDVLTARYISNTQRLNRLVRLWGTETINGEEVFTARKHYYPDMDESTEKLAKFFNVYDEVKEKPKGVRSAWFYFNPDKADDTETDWDNLLLSNNFNRALTSTLTCSLVIGPRLQRKRQTSAPITTPTTDQAGIIAEIKAGYSTWWDEGYTFHSSESDPYLAILSMYLLRSQDIPYTITVVEDTFSTTSLPTAETLDGVNRTEQVPAWRVRFVVENYNFGPDTDIIDMIQTDAKGQRTADIQVRNLLSASSVITTPEDGSDEDIGDYVYPSTERSVSDYWVKFTEVGPGRPSPGSTPGTPPPVQLVDHYYLKTSFLDSPLSRAEKLKYLISCVDTGYLKKKRKWYEVLAVFVIIVVSFWVGGAYAPSAAASLGFGAAVTSVVTISIALSVASLIMSLASLAASYMGAHNVATALGQFLRTISPLVRIAGVIAFVASIYSAIRRSAEQAAARAAERGVEATVMDTVRIVASNAVESLTGITKLADVTMAHVIKMVNFTFDIYRDWATRDLQRELKNYRREIAELAESRELAQTSDIVKDLMASYPNTLSNDWSYYAELYDRPYEWWSTPFHTGNIQATTVNALWLNDPQSAILYNNSLGDQ